MQPDVTAGDRSAIRACLPDLSLESVEPLGEGDFCHAYLGVERATEGGEPRTLVIRVPRHEEARAALEREACLLPRIGGSLPVAVPGPVVAVSEDGRHTVAVHEILAGTELWRDRWAALPDSDRRRLAREVGRFLRRLHDLGAAAATGCGIPTAEPGAFAWVQAHRLETEPGPVPTELRDPLRRCLAELHHGDASPEPRTLLHGDFGPGHTLYDPDTVELTGVIDWGDALVGDPARDFIFVYEDWGGDFLALALESYDPDDPGGFARRVHLHYLADQLGWVLDNAAGPGAAIAEGVDGLVAALTALETVR